MTLINVHGVGSIRICVSSKNGLPYKFWYRDEGLNYVCGEQYENNVTVKMSESAFSGRLTPSFP